MQILGLYASPEGIVVHILYNLSKLSMHTATESLKKNEKH